MHTNNQVLPAQPSPDKFENHSNSSCQANPSMPRPCTATFGGYTGNHLSGGSCSSRLHKDRKQVCTGEQLHARLLHCCQTQQKMHTAQHQLTSMVWKLRQHQELHHTAAPTPDASIYAVAAAAPHTHSRSNSKPAPQSPLAKHTHQHVIQQVL